MVILNIFTAGELLYPLLMISIMVGLQFAVPSATFSGVPSFDSTPISSALYNETIPGTSYTRLPTLYLPSSGPYLCKFQNKSSCVIQFPWSKFPPLIAYSPATNPQVNQIMENVRNTLATRTGSATIVPFSNATELSKVVEEATKNYTIAIYFEDSKRMDSSLIPGNSVRRAEKETCRPAFKDYNSLTGALSNRYTPMRYLPTACAAHGYLKQLFVAVQLAIDEAIFDLKIGNSSDLLSSVSIEQIPMESYISGIGLGSQRALVIYIPMGMMFFVQFILVMIVDEKEKRIKETMKIMGLSDSILWLSWFIPFAIVELFASLIASVLLVPTGVFGSSNFFIVFLAIFFYCLQLISLAFVASVFFDKVKVAGPLGFLISMLAMSGYLPFLIGTDWIRYRALVMIISLLLPSSGMCFAAEILFKAEAGYQGLNGISFADFGTPVDGYALVDPVMMMLAGTVVLAIIAWYLDNVVPSAHGTTRPATFIFNKQFWFPKDTAGVVAVERSMTHSIIVPPTPSCAREDDGTGIKATRLSLHGLTKTFTESRTGFMGAFKTVTGKLAEPKTVVNNVSFNAYEDQIFALLGHNGAGKTTAINMLVGLISPTAGDAYVYGNSIVNDMGEIRTSLGLCPQTNIILDKLTALEHIELLAAIKGVPMDEIHTKSIEMLANVKLSEKRDEFAMGLSGGQKRKLCVAMALVGDPKVIILDEPTTGMDPSSRREVWDLLRVMKKDKVMILTTHFMDEADILADRKAILVKGELKCIGSSLFLKNKFGVGYSLNCAVRNDNEELVTRYVSENIPESTIESHRGDTITFKLPFGSVRNLPATLRELDEHKDKYDLSGVGVSAVTLEEVFMSFSDHAEDAKAGTTDEHVKDTQEFEGLGGAVSKFKSKRAKRMRHIKAMATARALNFVLGGFGQYIFPIVFMFVGLVLQLTGGTIDLSGSPDPLHLTPLSATTATSANVFPYCVSGATTLSQANTMLQYGTDMLTPKCWKTAAGQAVGACDSAGIESYMYGQVNSGWSGQSGRNWVAGAVFDVINASLPDLRYSVLFDAHEPHSIPATISSINDAFLRWATNNASSISAYTLPLTSTVFGFSYAIGMQFLFQGLAAAAAVFGGDMVYDREKKIKHVLHVNGVSPINYWTGTFVFHGLILFILCIIAVIFMVAGDFQPIAGPALLPWIVTLFPYMLSCILFNYIFSFIFKKSTTAYAVIQVVNQLGAVVFGVAVMVMMQIDETKDAALVVHIVGAAIFPPYIMFGVSNMFFLTYINSTIEVIKGGTAATIANYFENTGVWTLYIIMPIQIIILFRLLVVLDLSRYKRSMFKRMTTSTSGRDDGDEDVALEMQRVDQMDTDGAHLVVKNVVKDYPSLRAVDGVSFAIGSGEIFGLLGPNGAGKTTTINMITSETIPSAGQVYVSGYDMAKDAFNAFEDIGFCSQDDALWEFLRPNDHLKIFGMIKNLNNEEIERRAQYLGKMFDLDEQVLKTPCGKLSGGQQRKLCVALSILSTPKIVLLDEPSSGLDVAARRKLWDVIAEFATRYHSSVILTTHIMSEAEYLCTRIGIMVDGTMRCIGSTQTLKSRFGMSYRLIVKVPDDRLEHLNETITTKLFPTATVHESRFGQSTFLIPTEDLLLWQAFDLMEQNMESLNVVEYSLSQTSLEQVYLRIAQGHRE